MNQPDPSNSPEWPQLGRLPQADFGHIEAKLPGLDRNPKEERPQEFRVVREVNTDWSPPLSEPIAMTVDDHDAIFVLDRTQQDAFRISRWTKALDEVSEIASIQQGDEEDQLRDPSALAVGQEPQLYLLDAESSVLSRFSPDGRWLDAYRCVADDDDDHFDGPQDVVVDRRGRIWIADSLNNRIVRFKPGEPGITFEQFQNPFEQLDNDEFFEPASLDVSIDGTFYVADTNQNRILRFDAQFKLLTQLAGDDLFEFPSQVRLSSNGQTLYVTDQRHLRVQRFDQQGQRTGILRLENVFGQRIASRGPLIINSAGQVVLINPQTTSLIVLEFVH